MKRTIAILLSMMMCAGLLAGCGVAPAPSDAAASAAQPASEPAEPAAPAASATGAVPTGDKPIALLIPSPVGDPFIALCVKGLEKLSEETGAELKIIETLDPTIIPKAQKNPVEQAGHRAAQARESGNDGFRENVSVQGF